MRKKLVTLSDKGINERETTATGLCVIIPKGESGRETILSPRLASVSKNGLNFCFRVDSDEQGVFGCVSVEGVRPRWDQLWLFREFFFKVFFLGRLSIKKVNEPIVRPRW